MPKPSKEDIIRKLEANYSIKSIRDDLISQGFSPKDVDKAIEDALKTFGKVVSKKKSSSKSSDLQKSYSGSDLGIFQKIKMILISPRELYRSIKEEDLKKTIEFGLILYSLFSVLAFFMLFISLFLTYLYSSPFTMTGYIVNQIFNTLRANIAPMLIIFSMLLLSFLGYSLGISIIASLYLHLCVKIARIKSKTWDYTLKALIYSNVLYLYILPIAILFLILTFLFNLPTILLIVLILILYIWDLAILCIGISELHDTSIVRAILTIIIFVAIPLLVSIAINLIFRGLI